MSHDYLIWSNEHAGWWGPNSCGYTRDLKLAGRYPRDVATRICAQAMIGSRNGIPNEIPILERDYLECLVLREP